MQNKDIPKLLDDISDFISLFPVTTISETITVNLKHILALYLNINGNSA